MLGATAAAAAQDKTAQPIERKKGATILGPRDPAREIENPDFLQPPDTDHGDPQSSILIFRPPREDA